MRINIIFILVLFFYNNAITQCGNPDASIWNDTWQSCESSQNPNPARGEGHWIQYDFGAIYTLSKTHIWNTNEVGKTQNGFKNVTVDYSEDGVTWEELGSFDFLQGTEEAVYGGFEGFDFEGEIAQYVIITANSNWGGDCFGLAEVKFNLLLDINGEDVPCDDPPCNDDCEPIDDIVILEVDAFSALLGWDEVATVEGYIVLIRIVDEEEWDEIIVDDPQIFLDDLDDETEYEIQVIVICEDEEESDESESFFFTTLEEGTSSINFIEKNGISKLQFVPNPASTKVNLIFDSKIRGVGEINIRNVNGSMIKKDFITLNFGKNNHIISVYNFPSGVYFITLENQDRNIALTKRLVVINN